MASWTKMTTAAGWEAWEKGAAEMGEVVKALKTSGGDKDAITAAVEELMSRKKGLGEALTAAIEAAPDEAAKEVLRAKLPPPPSKSKSDKKKDKKDGAASGEKSAADLEKEANMKKNEELKAAARAKKKAEAEAKPKGGGGEKKAAAPALAPAAATAVAPQAAGAAPAAATTPAVAATGGKNTKGTNKTMELHYGKDHPPLMAMMAAKVCARACVRRLPLPHLPLPLYLIVWNSQGMDPRLPLCPSLVSAPPADASCPLALPCVQLAKREVVLKKVEDKQLAATGGRPMLLLPLGGGLLAGDLVIARYFARLPSADGGASLLYGNVDEPLSQAAVDQYIDQGDTLATLAGPALTSTLQGLNRRLAMRATLCGHAPSLADAATWLALKKNPAADKGASGGAGGPHLRRWYKYFDSLPPSVGMAQDFFGVQKDAGSMELNLVGAEMGKVVTRFPPEPSGHLHIGHVKACMLNAYFANKYEGKMLLRFDDTNPSKEKEEYEEAIVKDLERLQIVPHSVSHTSDHFKAIKVKAEWMIQQGLAYCDPSPQEEQQKGRFDKVNSKYRDTPVAENLRLFNEMHKASEEGLLCCLRAKIDMQSNNGSLRDPTIFRTNLTPHAQTKDTYKAYPTYDLACPIVDSIEGVTHALRDLQYSDRDEQYNWFLDKLQLRKVEIWGFSRINFVRTLLSKRKLQWLVDEKKAEGWDDPRFPTVAGILRRGMTVPGLKAFILSMGASRNSNLMEWDRIWNTNKSIIDPAATRLTALLSGEAPYGLVPLILSNGPDAPYAESLFKHPKDETLGKKVRLFGGTVYLQADDATACAVGEEVTLMSWGNAIIKEVKSAGGKVVALHGELHLAGSVKSTKKKLTWLADTPDNLVDVQLVDLDFIITKDKVEEDDKLEDIFTEKSVLTYPAKGEAAFRAVRKGETIQVERRGFYICDVPYLRPDEPMKFFFVPDGKNMMGVATASTKAAASKAAPPKAAKK